MKAFKLVLIFLVIFLITGCTKTENNNIIERSSRENDDVTVAVVLSSESAIIPDQQITETVSQPANSHETEQKEEPDQVAEETQITIDKCQVNAEGEYTDIWTQELFELINTERTNNGLNELQYDVTLEACADVRSQEASQFWSHTRPDGQKWNSVCLNYYRGENLARGYNSAKEIFDAWMASESHRNNILHSQYTTIGISIFKTERGYVICAGFGI